MPIYLERSFITDEGRLFPVESRHLRDALGLAYGLPESLSYAVENIGFVGLTQTSTHLLVRMRPRILTRRAVITLCRWLVDRADSPVALAWFSGVWNLSQFPCVSAALQFVDHLVEDRAGANIVERPWLCAHSETAEKRWNQIESDVRTAFSNPTALTNLLDAKCSARWSLVDVDVANRDVHVVRQGRGNPPFDPMFARPTGYNVNELHDSRYRSNSRQTFLDLAESGQSRFEAIDTMVDWPRLGHLRLRYWRAMVALSRSTDRAVFLSITSADGTIDLRRRPRQVLADTA